jgi:osmotically inducible lipoprotein OsmB
VGNYDHWRLSMNTMKRITLAATLSLTLVALAACGNSTGDRALSGGAIGAGVGALGGALVGSPGTGALIGGAVGAGTGALTNSNQIDLGKPVWR